MSFQPLTISDVCLFGNMELQFLHHPPCLALPRLCPSRVTLSDH